MNYAGKVNIQNFTKGNQKKKKADYNSHWIFLKELKDIPYICATYPH